MTVEYGADLHSSEKGSGFPIASTAVEADEQVWGEHSGVYIMCVCC